MSDSRAGTGGTDDVAETSGDGRVGEVESHGSIVLAATPIGNSRDASARLVDLLATADVIAAEDTRRLRALADRLGVTPSGTIRSFYEHNEEARSESLLEAVDAGQTVLVVSDAGMPAVSDPGFRLVAAAAASGRHVTAAPGPSAVLTALALSGLPTDRFCFEGFLPRKPGDRRKVLSELSAERRTLVFFESPHRLADSLADLAASFGAERRAAVCRELTKTHEEVRRDTLQSLREWAADGVRGEICIVVHGAPPPEPARPEDLVGAVGELTGRGVRLKEAAATVAAEHGLRTRELYEAVIKAR